MMETTTTQFADTQRTAKLEQCVGISEGETQRLAEISSDEFQNAASIPFSAKASNKLRQKIQEYSSHLGAESIRVSRWRQSEQVSTADVDLAAQHLIANSSRKLYRRLRTIGGILLGAAVQNVLTMITNDRIEVSSMVVTFALTLIWTLLIAGFEKD